MPGSVSRLRAAVGGSAVFRLSSGWPGTPSALAARANSIAPSASTSSMSWPRGILISASCRHCAIGSRQAATRNRHSPSEVTVTSAPSRSVPGASSRI